MNWVTRCLNGSVRIWGLSGWHTSIDSEFIDAELASETGVNQVENKTQKCLIQSHISTNLVNWFSLSTSILFSCTFHYCCQGLHMQHDNVIKWKHFPCNWPFANSPHKGQWRGALMFTLICARINGWVNNRKAGDLRRHRAYYEFIVMIIHLSMVSTVMLHLNQRCWLNG